ncbi:MAG: ABC transporter substrate-binding protein [Chlamydiota bacterium]
MINVKTHPLKNKQLRQALSLALDRREIVEHVLRIGGTPATGFLSGCLRLSNQNLVRENKAQAKQLFAAALKELNLTLESLPILTISHRNLPRTAKIMAAIQGQWQKTLGIRVQLKSRDYKAHMAALFASDYEIGDVTWCSKVKDPIYMPSFFLDAEAKINDMNKLLSINLAPCQVINSILL